LVWAAVLCVSWSIASCVKGEAQSASQIVDTRDSAVKVTFIELGSVSCVPCKAMQPIMEELRRKYPADLRVVFHDVWTEQGKPYVSKHRIKLIPTQVFLDSGGKEFYRHEGFFAQEELEKVLRSHGVSK
jgi:thioredoxin 1